MGHVAAQRVELSGYRKRLERYVSGCRLLRRFSDEYHDTSNYCIREQTRVMVHQQEGS